MKRTFIISLAAILWVGTQALHAQSLGDEDNGIAVKTYAWRERIISWYSA